MPIKILSALIAVALMLAYLLPLVFKLKEAALGVVVAIGVAMMLVDLWHSMRSPEP
jgi:hypothetical protein